MSIKWDKDKKEYVAQGGLQKTIEFILFAITRYVDLCISSFSLTQPSILVSMYR